VSYSSGMPAAGLLLALLLQVAGGPAPPRASISGRVIDKASGQPLPRMAVALVPPDRAKAVETLTDNEGRYQFVDLAPGKYAVGADNDDHHATYLRQWFGSDEPASIFTLPAPNIEVAGGESRTGVDIALTRALAIAGHVFDPAGEPLPGTEVFVTDPDGRALAVRSSRSDDLGGYRVFGLRPGNYRVCAALRTGGDSPMPAAGLPPARTCYPVIPLVSQDAFNVDIRTDGPTGSRPTTPGDAVVPTVTETTGTLHGLVTDKQNGRPLPNATVHLGYRGPAQSTALPSTMTNEGGEFRISGLAPGQYTGFATATGHLTERLSDRSNTSDITVRRGEVVQVSAALPVAYAINVRLVDPFDAPVSAVGVAVRSVDGQQITTAFANSSDDLGHVRVSGMGPGRYVICAEPTDVGATTPRAQRQKAERLIRSCYLSTATEAEAQPVTVGSADIDDLELRMVRGRGLSIAGTILDASGAPAPRAAVGFTKYIDTGMSATGFAVRPDGQFLITNVQPGAYAIEATTDREAAFVPIRVDDDVENLVVAMRQTVTVRGLIAVDDASSVLPSAAGRAPLSVSARLADDRLPDDGSNHHATANSDGTFTLEGLFGRRTIAVSNVPSGWYVKAIRYGSRDVIDEVVEFKPDGNAPLEIVLSNRGASITGTIADVIDHRVARAQVWLFRAPVNKDAAPSFAGSVLSVTGNYAFGPLRDGDYLIVAVPAGIQVPQVGDWERLASLAGLADHVTLTEMDQRTIALRVTAVR
jgi:protocatechuate 3,4-dioxygenase beta subunit